MEESGQEFRRACGDELRQNFVKLSSYAIWDYSRLQVEAAIPVAPKAQKSSSNGKSVLHL